MDIRKQISQPTLLLDETRVRANLARMATKAAHSGVRLRPHFKTHQSAQIGDWFREYGTQAITVSSVEMADYFANHGWVDITIAFPVNLRQIAALNRLAQRVQLGLLVESMAVVEQLDRQLTSPVAIWLKVDVGYRRTGLAWDDKEGALAVAAAVARSRLLRMVGILTHAGHTYPARGAAAVRHIYREALSRLQALQASLRQSGFAVAISIGDTPGCSVVESFAEVDEIRPGNYVFYDVMQWEIGACRESDIAVALACPIVAKHPARQQLVIYGGAVHLSKESLTTADGCSSYGRIAQLRADGWVRAHPSAHVVSLSQEHGIVDADTALLADVQVGDLLAVLPVHSCLTANLSGRYLTVSGEEINMARYK